MALLTNKVSGNTWHTRLGHPNIRTLNTLSPCLSSTNKQVDFCESCVMGKSSKLPFQNCNSHVPIFLHTDVWGSAPIMSFDGYCYYLVIINEFSRHIWIFHLARKFEVITIFPKFIKMVEKQFNTTVKCIQSDGGGEFVNHTLKNYFASRGIFQKFSCPGTPEQNGLAE